MRYLDSCVPIDNIIGMAAPGWDPSDRVTFSELLGVEARRTFRRLHREGELSDETFIGAMESVAELEGFAVILPITNDVLRIASGAFAAPIRTLDAIHLASAMVLRERRYPDLMFATHDRRLAGAARAEGFAVAGVD
jgi:predicted nucleic acid-binding protein